MLDILNSKSSFEGASIPVRERPCVLEAKHSLDETRSTFDKAKSRLDAIERTLARSVTSSCSPTDYADEIAMIRARAALPQAQQEYWEAEAVLRGVERSFQKTIEAETVTLTLARAEARRPLVQRLFARLDEAKAVAEEIEAYDRKTTTLGAKPQGHPFSELLDEPHRTGFVTFRRQLLEKEGAL